MVYNATPVFISFLLFATMMGINLAFPHYANKSLDMNALSCAHVRKDDSFNKTRILGFFMKCMSIILWQSWTWREGAVSMTTADTE